MKLKPLFGKFGMEPTFYPLWLKYVSQAWNQDDDYEEILTPAIEQMVEVANSQRHDGPYEFNHPWGENIHNDESCLECSTPVMTKWNDFERKYKSLLKKLLRLGFVESSKICMDSEGGCHLSFDMEKMFDDLYAGHTAKGAEGAKYAKQECLRFLRNFCVFIRNNPALVWTFVAPNDNRSAELTYRGLNPDEFEKGHFINTNRNSKHLDLGGTDYYGNSNYYEFHARIEMRFFMMPRNIKEMKLHFDTGNQLMHHIYDLTFNKKVELKDLYNMEKIRAFSYERAHKNIKEVCKILGIEYSRLVKCGKIDNLKTRFKSARRDKKFLLNIED